MPNSWTVLRTQRLTLRPYQVTDAARIGRLGGDINVARNLATMPSPYPTIAAEGWILLNRLRVRQGLALGYVAETSEDGLIGMVGGAFAGEAVSFGYWVGKPYWGLGYATEMSKAFLDHCFSNRGVKAAKAGYFLDNPASRRVQEKLGLHPIGPEDDQFSLGRGENVRHQLMEIRLEDWRNRAGSGMVAA